MAVLFSDDFNRANGSLGANWAGDGSISSNQLAVSGSPGEAFCVNGSAAAIDCKVSVKWNGGDGGPMARASSSSGGSSYYLDAYSGSVDIYRRNNGSDAAIATGISTPASGDVFTLEVSGTNPVQIKAYKNGVQIGSTYNDSSGSRLTATGLPGVLSWDNASRFDDFLVEDLATGGEAYAGTGSVAAEAALSADGAKQGGGQGAATAEARLSASGAKSVAGRASISVRPDTEAQGLRGGFGDRRLERLNLHLCGWVSIRGGVRSAFGGLCPIRPRRKAEQRRGRRRTSCTDRSPSR